MRSRPWTPTAPRTCRCFSEQRWELSRIQSACDAARGAERDSLSLVAKAQRERQAASAAGAAQPTTVLVVDDEPALHETIARYLKGYRRVPAYNGWQARQALAKHHVDVVLLDLNLPDTTGLKLLEEIRNERDDVEIIILTSHSELHNA